MELTHIETFRYRSEEYRGLFTPIMKAFLD